jgi:glycosyltransferase involved in cell wall biosynthesis
VVTALGHGGAEIWLLNLIAPLRALGVDVEFVLKAPHLGNLRHVAEERGAATHHIPLRATQIDYVLGVARLLRRGNFDVLHVHDFIYSGLGVLAAEVARKPTVLTFHHYTFEPQTPLTRRPGVRQARELYGRLNLRYAIAHADVLSTLSKTVMAEVVPDHSRRSNCEILRLSTEIPTMLSRGERERIRSELDLPERAPVFIHVGRFIEQKNHLGLLRIFRTVLRARPDAVLVLLGQGPMQDQILAEASDLIGRKQVRFLGLRDDVHRLFGMSDVLLFPSLNEGFGLVALEANACGLPVVGTRIRGLDEAVAEGETALLFDIDDEEGMAAAAIDLIQAPDRAARIGAAGRERARRLFSHESSAAILSDVYDRVLSRRSRG